MIVDDRLETVLRTVAAGGAGIRTQYRQLADILGRTGAAAWNDGHDEALRRLDALHDELGDEEGAGLLKSCALRSPRLVQHFANRGPKAAIAAIAHARLAETEWLAMIPALPVQARGFLRHRRDLGSTVEALLEQLGIDDFALPEPDGYVAPALPPQPVVQREAARPAPPRLVQTVPVPARETVAEPVALASAPPSAPVSASEGIGAIVRRIEAFRRAREVLPPIGAEPEGEAGAQAEAPVQSTPPATTAIDIRIDADGTICAAEPSFAAMLVGSRPFTGEPEAPATCDAQTLRAVRARLPLEAGLVTLEGAGPVAGSWRIDAAPHFAREGGHFLGYHARLRRPHLADKAAANDDDTHGSGDRLRQLLHELRTPINAIQGFAELIQQQLFGPTPHQYRSLAASIASDAARMLAGFEEVERLVKLETGRSERAEGEADLVAVLGRLVSQLEPVIGPREVKLRCNLPEMAITVAMDAGELERTLWRMLSVIAGAAAPGERLSIMLAAGAGYARLSLPLPAALALRDDATLFAPDGGRAGGAMGSAMLGSGFALRLAAAEVRAAGGVLSRNGARLTVDLPLLTVSGQPLSQEAAAGTTG
ncbi:histidine kinase dimerization/phospho-acceptor domain-containing protein [Novosphingobium cyanobacteriorum]|uniref:histidine kinase n=1 Tax=Novosphingobium cyanobacteriorum TaxID=3024215 RepID=A0ABT6CLE7_9SPHN|nr:histidine kinase dimerization/phospho-acceptor domain-containing protein [Novosphingobium cyanobacteriorum]MDF8334388.1 histidine kinase dimerization/phospho-acceptor domain-containing protein [Novosphingobium cyanobacteriorum]